MINALISKCSCRGGDTEDRQFSVEIQAKCSIMEVGGGVEGGNFGGDS